MKTYEKMELKVFQQSYVDKLYREVSSTNNCDGYKLDSFPYEEKFPEGTTALYIDKGFTLDGNKNDLENTKALYSQLKTMNTTQASDERFWTYLTHVVFWRYMRERWPAEKAQDGKELGRIKDRYFLRSPNIESLTRNGIARLWWYGYLTYDKNRENPFELTEILLKRADLSVGITERAIGSNRNIRIAILEFLKEHSVILDSEDETRKLLKELNLCGGVRNLPFLQVTELKGILQVIAA